MTNDRQLYKARARFKRDEALVDNKDMSQMRRHRTISALLIGLPTPANQ
jgi:hypothetical protein